MLRALLSWLPILIVTTSCVDPPKGRDNDDRADDDEDEGNTDLELDPRPPIVVPNRCAFTTMTPAFGGHAFGSGVGDDGLTRVASVDGDEIHVWSGDPETGVGSVVTLDTDHEDVGDYNWHGFGVVGDVAHVVYAVPQLQGFRHAQFTLDTVTTDDVTFDEMPESRTGVPSIFEGPNDSLWLFTGRIVDGPIGETDDEQFVALVHDDDGWRSEVMMTFPESSVQTYQVRFDVEFARDGRVFVAMATYQGDTLYALERGADGAWTGDLTYVASEEIYTFDLVVDAADTPWIATHDFASFDTKELIVGTLDAGQFVETYRGESWGSVCGLLVDNGRPAVLAIDEGLQLVVPTDPNDADATTLFAVDDFTDVACGRASALADGRLVSTGSIRPSGESTAFGLFVCGP